PPLSIHLPESDFSPCTVALIPFGEQPMSPGIFVLADDDPAGDRLSPMLPLLQRIVSLTAAKLDNLGLMHELKRLNQDLEHVVEARTQALQQANQELRRQIQDRKQAEEALRVSEARYRAVSELTSDYAFAFKVEPDGSLTYEWIAGALARITGYTPDELAARGGWKSVVYPDDWPVAQAQFKSLLAGQVSVIEYRIVSKSGELRWVRDYARPTWDKTTKRVTHIHGAVQDISDYKQAQEEIHRRNRELALLNRIITTSIAAPEPELILQTACRELGRFFNAPYAGATLLNRRQTEAIVVDTLQSAGRAAATTIPLPAVTGELMRRHFRAHKTPQVIDNAHTDPRLTPFHDLFNQRGIVLLLILPLFAKDDIVGGIGLGFGEPKTFSDREINLAWNVTSQVAGVLARAQLNQEWQLLSVVVEQATDGVIITDTAGAILYINPAFEQMTGFSREEVIGQTPRILKSGEHDAALYRELWATITAGQAWQGRITNQTKDGTPFTVDAVITPVLDKEGAIVNYVGLQRDITRELALEKQYYQAQKMEAVGQLTAGVAHDFNNMLTAINGYASLIRHSMQPEDRFKDEVDSILQAGRRATNLIRQLLTFSRKQIINPQILNLNHVVSDIHKMLRAIIGEAITLDTALAPDLGAVKLDPAQVEQIIVNLAVNARDAMSGGGRLTLETANVVLDEAYAANHMNIQPGDYVMLAVSDTGIGMSEEVQSHIFEPFFTTKEMGSGSGLGLATVYGIVQQNEGQIYVYSEAGRGTTFKIYFPRVEQAAPPVETGPATETTLPGGLETILLVEDDVVVRKVTQKILGKLGYVLLVAEDGRQALQLVAGH
ncbi:MAG: PAS domain S-box protein, partial [Anaerolineae bacterium]